MEYPNKPPPGGDQNRGPVMTVVISVFLGLSSIAIVLRMYIRTRIVQSIGSDDYTVLMAWVSGDTLE